MILLLRKYRIFERFWGPPKSTKMKHSRFCLYVEHFFSFRVFLKTSIPHSWHTCTRTELTFETCLSKEREARLLFYIVQARDFTLKR